MTFATSRPMSEQARVQLRRYNESLNVNPARGSSPTTSVQLLSVSSGLPTTSSTSWNVSSTSSFAQSVVQECGGWRGGRGGRGCTRQCHGRHKCNCGGATLFQSPTRTRYSTSPSLNQTNQTRRMMSRAFSSAEHIGMLFVAPRLDGAEDRSCARGGRFSEATP